MPGRLAMSVVLLFANVATLAADRPDTVPGELRQYATIRSLGLEWAIEGGSNRNSQCAVRYRRRGGVEWRQAFGPLRIDHHGSDGDNKADRADNTLAGSILFLDPGTGYDVRFDLTDPDGGKAEKLLAVSTRPLPARPADGRAIHVVPADKGGFGTEAAPSLGLETAQAAAKPGDPTMEVPRAAVGNLVSRH